MTGPRKLGSYRPTPRWWKDLVLEEMERRGHGARKELAKFAGCTGGAITQLLQADRPNRKSPDTSRIAAKVAEWSGIPLPDEIAFADLGEYVAELAALKALNPDALHHVMATIRALRAAEEKSRKR